MKNKTPVIITYSWEPELAQVFLCDTDDEAETLLRKLYEEERTVEIEENERIPGVDLQAAISDNSRYANITVLWYDSVDKEEKEDVTEYMVGSITDWKQFKNLYPLKENNNV